MFTLFIKTKLKIVQTLPMKLQIYFSKIGNIDKSMALNLRNKIRYFCLFPCFSLRISLRILPVLRDKVITQQLYSVKSEALL